jgi:hypothetical protein
MNIERRGYQQLLALAERQVQIARIELRAQNLRIVQLKVLSAKKTSKLPRWRR